MYLYCFMCCILFIPLISGNSINSTKIDSDRIKTTNGITEASIGKKIPAKAIGKGIPSVNNGTMVLPKDDSIIDLRTLDNELGTTKLKPVHARKGAGNPLGEPQIPQNISIINGNKTKVNTILPEKPHQDLNKLVTMNSNQNNSESKVEHTPKKPLVLSSEALDKNVLMEGMIPLVKSSSKTLISDQIPPPNRDVKSYKMATNHPGLVTPIVITILVVPVFALLGYMAFTRGREAWKNRHYKRMDFLLDGMYNE